MSLIELKDIQVNNNLNLEVNKKIVSETHKKSEVLNHFP